jgi:hypothetical protein
MFDNVAWFAVAQFGGWLNRLLSLWCARDNTLATAPIADIAIFKVIAVPTATAAAPARFSSNDLHCCVLSALQSISMVIYYQTIAAKSSDNSVT